MPPRPTPQRTYYLMEWSNEIDGGCHLGGCFLLKVGFLLDGDSLLAESCLLDGNCLLAEGYPLHGDCLLNGTGFASQLNVQQLNVVVGRADWLCAEDRSQPLHRIMRIKKV
jgi:hypothetical protein